MVVDMFGKLNVYGQETGWRHIKVFTCTGSHIKNLKPPSPLRCLAEKYAQIRIQRTEEGMGQNLTIANSLLAKTTTKRRKGKRKSVDGGGI